MLSADISQLHMEFEALAGRLMEKHGRPAAVARFKLLLCRLLDASATAAEYERQDADPADEGLTPEQIMCLARSLDGQGYIIVRRSAAEGLFDTEVCHASDR